MYIQPTRWLLDEALWEYYWGRYERADKALIKVIRRTVKDEDHGKGQQTAA